MSVKVYLVNRPTKACLDILKARLRPKVEDKEFEECEAILLVQGGVAELIKIVDLVTKVVCVKAAEVVGNCPQQLNTIVFWGGTAEIEQAFSTIGEIKGGKLED